MAVRPQQTVPPPTRARRIGVPLAAVLVLGAGTVAMGSGDPAADAPAAVGEGPISVDPRGVVQPRPEDPRVSRSGERPAVAELVREAAAGRARIDLDSRWLTTDLNVWTGPGEQHVPADSPAAVSGVLAAEPCPDGSAVESGLGANAVAVHRSVCAAFPEATTRGGLRPGDDGLHGTGQAVDIMVTDAGMGDSIAAYVLDNASSPGVSEILWAQQIWTADRSGEGWRPMEDRGSVTANHYDHVHVSVY